MSKRYALLDESNIVLYIGGELEYTNSEPGLSWVQINDNQEVKTGYRYIPEYHQFERVRKSILSEKQDLLKLVNVIYEKKMGYLLSDYSQYEVMTFPRQAQELDFYNRMKQGDQTGKIVFIRALCQARQIPEEILWEKLDQKNTAFTWASGWITGTRQRFEDLINYASTYLHLDEIEEQIKKWRDE